MSTLKSAAHLLHNSLRLPVNRASQYLIMPTMTRVMLVANDLSVLPTTLDERTIR
jgi:hypothetical protein